MHVTLVSALHIKAWRRTGSGSGGDSQVYVAASYLYTVHAPRQRFISSRQMLMVLMEDLSARARPAGHPIDTFHVFVFVPIIFYLYLESGLPVAQGGFWLVVVFTSWWTKGLRANS